MTEDRTLAVSIATQAEAEAGTNSTRLMTPQRVKQAVDVRLATEVQALAGNDHTQLMTPQRVAQFFAAQPKGEIKRLTRTSNVKLTAAEIGRFADITSGSFTQRGQGGTDRMGVRHRSQT